MVKKKMDNRIRVLIENGVTLGHRSLFVIVGEKAKDQVYCFVSFISSAFDDMPCLCFVLMNGVFRL